jgi:putative tricarboxylic transport membrane protein
VLIPITYGMNPTTALITMCAVYYGAMFGGSRASIMINTPGDASAIVTCFDGYPMAKSGRAGEALAISAWASFVGGMVGMVFLIFLTEPVAAMALKFGPSEKFALMLFALTATITLSEGSILKGFIAMGIGFMMSTIGMDGQSGAMRFTMGIEHLQDGIDFLVIMIGFYAVTEVFKNFKSINDVVKLDSKTIGKVSMPAETWKRSSCRGCATRRLASWSGCCLARAAPSPPSCPTPSRNPPASTRKSSARVRSKDWPGRNRRTTPVPAARWCRC